MPSHYLPMQILREIKKHCPMQSSALCYKHHLSRVKRKTSPGGQVSKGCRGNIVALVVCCLLIMQVFPRNTG